MKILACQTKDNDLHMAAHKKLSKIRSELCWRNIYWPSWRMRDRERPKKKEKERVREEGRKPHLTIGPAERKLGK